MNTYIQLALLQPYVDPEEFLEIEQQVVVLQGTN